VSVAGWLKVLVNRGTVTIGGARVIKADIGASNGVIHVIQHGARPRYFRWLVRRFAHDYSEPRPA